MLFNFQIHSDLEEVHKYVDKKLLPKEYGGDMPMSEMIGEFNLEDHLEINI